MEYQGFECQQCGTKDDQLNIHHPYYKRGAMIWQYDKYELQCLCNKCHKDAHAKDETIKKLIADPNICKDELIGVLKAMNDTPYTRLNSCEEIAGYLTYHGIPMSQQRFLENFIITSNGNPHDAINDLPVETSYYDIAAACELKFDSPIDLLIKSEEIFMARIATYKKGIR